MSNLRFAPITSGLLARKGQAGPSQLFPPPPESYWRAAPRTNGSTASVTMPPQDEVVEAPVEISVKAAHHDDRPHKVRVSLSENEFERFGIAAVKRGIARHQLLREAINDYVDRLMRDYENCGCITGVATTACCRG
jgi:hypothetical protein